MVYELRDSRRYKANYLAEEEHVHLEGESQFKRFCRSKPFDSHLDIIRLDANSLIGATFIPAASKEVSSCDSRSEIVTIAFEA